MVTPVMAELVGGPLDGMDVDIPEDVLDQLLSVKVTFGVDQPCPYLAIYERPVYFTLMGFDVTGRNRITSSYDDRLHLVFAGFEDPE